MTTPPMRFPSFPLMLSAVLAPATVHAQTTEPPRPLCDARQGFGIVYGTKVNTLRALHPARVPYGPSDAPYAVYVIDRPVEDARFTRFMVTTYRKTGEIHEVTAYGPPFDPGEESRYDDLTVPYMRPLAAAFAQDTGLPLSTEGRPPWFGKGEEMKFSIYHDYDFRASKLSITYTCVGVKQKNSYISRAFRDMR